MELQPAPASYCAGQGGSSMRQWLLAAVAALVLASGPVPAADLARAPEGAAGADAAAEVTEAEGGALGAVLGVLFAERPSGAPPAEAEVVRSFTDRWGVPCREYVQRVLIGEEEVEASGTVCRAADGSWAMRE
jgi:hypothetical protein